MNVRLVTILLVLAASSAAVRAQHWPAFRGPGGAGVAPGGRPPVTWNIDSSHNVAWRTPVPGLGHSSPVVWGDRIYLTTAIAPGAEADALALGDVDRAGTDPAKDLVPHRWQFLALDKSSGNVLWARDVHEGVPRVKRHVKGSHASATPATDGRYIVALMGSEGLFAFDMNGRAIWRKDLGPLSVGLADDPTYEWGPASSPVIAGDRVIVQNDRYKELLYIVTDNGILSVYRVGDGSRVYQRRLSPSAGSFSASPVAADGRVYFASEDGQVFVVRAGEAFELLAANEMNEPCLATPAISGDMLLVRTKSHLYAIAPRSGSSSQLR